MTAHVLPYSPGELVRQCAAARPTLHQLVVAAFLRTAPQLVLDMLGRSMVREIDGLALKYAQFSLEYESLAERVLNAPEELAIDGDDSLHALLYARELKVQDIAGGLRAVWGTMRPGSGRRRAAIRMAALRLADATQATAEAARNLRGAIQAHDANVAALRLARQAARQAPCSTAAQLDAVLDAAFHGQ